MCPPSSFTSTSTNPSSSLSPTYTSSTSTSSPLPISLTTLNNFPPYDPVINGLTSHDIDVITPKTPDVLMFIVHGMGRQSWLGRNIANVRSTFASLCHDSRLTLNFRNILVIPVEYHSKLHAKYNQRVSDIKLSTCAALRTIINDFAVDPLYYFTPDNGKFVRDEVTQQLNSLYSAFLTAHPNFSGEVTVLAHSMGGLIMWDLLNKSSQLPSGILPTTDPLILPLRRVFCMGSPISNCIVLRGHDPSMYSPRVPFLNIHHPHDPVAYRFEPLFHSDWQRIPPVMIEPYVPISTADVDNNNAWIRVSRHTSWFTSSLPVLRVPTVPLPTIPTFSSVVPNSLRSFVTHIMGSGSSSTSSSDHDSHCHTINDCGGIVSTQDNEDMSLQIKTNGNDEMSGDDNEDGGYLSDNESGNEPELLSSDVNQGRVTTSTNFNSYQVLTSSSPSKVIPSYLQSNPTNPVKSSCTTNMTNNTIPYERNTNYNDNDYDIDEQDESHLSSSSSSIISLSTEPPPRKRYRIPERQISSTSRCTSKKSRRPRPDPFVTTAATLWAMFIGEERKNSCSSSAGSSSNTNTGNGGDTPCSHHHHHYGLNSNASSNHTDRKPSLKRKRAGEIIPKWSRPHSVVDRLPSSSLIDNEDDAIVTEFAHVIASPKHNNQSDQCHTNININTNMMNTRSPSLSDILTKPDGESGELIKSPSSPSHFSSYNSATTSSSPLPSTSSMPSPSVLSPTTSHPNITTLPFGYRIDYELPIPTGVMSTRLRHVDVASEYISGLRAHFDYWADRDLMWFVLSSLNGIGPAGNVCLSS